MAARSHHARHPGEVLEDDPGRQEGELDGLLGASGVQLAEGEDVLLEANSVPALRSRFSSRIRTVNGSRSSGTETCSARADRR
jgi:hypothetical protein